MTDLHRVILKCTIGTAFNRGNSSSNVLNRVQILQSVNILGITNCEDVIGLLNFLFMVLELADGGELFDKIIKMT